MNIAMTVPSMSVPHGGIRIILEWANRLSIRHKVTLFFRKWKTPPAWIDISPRIMITSNLRDLREHAILVICSPHDIDLIKMPEMPRRKFIFLQMLEHLFRPGDLRWLNVCTRAYGCNVPIILISKWNQAYIERNFPFRTAKTYYVGNGVNFHDFPIEPNCKKDSKTVLIEGWESSNATKDLEAIAPMTAQMLKDDGYKILAYSHLPLNRFPDVPDEYYLRPSLNRLNDLYRRASILVKASRYDARSCSPLEAMTKGTVTVRAITQGDDDLKDKENCLRIEYHDEVKLYNTVSKLFDDQDLLSKLKTNCLEYVQKYSWDYWMPQIEEILLNG